MVDYAPGMRTIIRDTELRVAKVLPKSGKQVFTKNKKALCPVLTESTKCPYSSRSLECDLPLFSCFLSASSL